MFTMGGGIVIDPHPSRLHRRNRQYVVEEIELREKGGPHERLLQLLDEEIGLTISELAGKLKTSADQVQAWSEELMGELKMYPIPGTTGFISAVLLTGLLDQLEEKIRAHYTKERYHTFVPKAQILSQLSRKLKPKVYDGLLQIAVERGRLEVMQDRIRIAGYEVPLSLREKQIMEQVLAQFKQQPYQPPTLQELMAGNKGQEKFLLGVLLLLKEKGILVEVEEGLLFAKETIDQTPALLADISSAEGFTVAEFRDRVGSSRKFALGLLEYLDKLKWTKRVEDRRVLIRE
jgi:selenocysteine-specific elongation factor